MIYIKECLLSKCDDIPLLDITTASALITVITYDIATKINKNSCRFCSSAVLFRLCPIQGEVTPEQEEQNYYYTNFSQ